MTFHWEKFLCTTWRR